MARAEYEYREPLAHSGWAEVAADYKVIGVRPLTVSRGPLYAYSAREVTFRVTLKRVYSVREGWWPFRRAREVVKFEAVDEVCQLLTNGQWWLMDHEGASSAGEFQCSGHPINDARNRARFEALREWDKCA